MTRPACAAAALRLIASLGAAVLLAIGWTPPAGAHAVLIRSAPPGRATLAEKPDRVQLWFNERLEPAFSSVSVWSSAGTQVDAGDARVGPDDAKRLSVTLPPLPPGAYSVRYRVLSVDGHVIDSSFSFAIRDKPPAK
jgi:methionine-rich copper-binding protein CopC